MEKPISQDPGGMPPAGVPYGPMGPQAMPQQMYYSLAELLRGIESLLPICEVAHSLDDQLLKDPVLRALPAVTKLHGCMMQFLHNECSVAGFIRRILCGDTDPTVLDGLQHEVGEMLGSHAALLAAFVQVAALPEAARNPVVQCLGQVLTMFDQAFRSLEPLIRPLAPPAALADPN